MAAPTATSPVWGYCRFCGVAVAPGAAACAICGAENPIPAAGLPAAPARTRRRVRLTGTLRTLIVVVVVAFLAYDLISTVVAGPPSPADPLTTAGLYTLNPGAYTVISGEITGGDFVVGNFTTTSPVGTNLELTVYNSSGWSLFRAAQGPASVYSLGPTPAGHLVFSAQVTDVYYFVFTNPYPSSANFNERVYIATTYMSNVAQEGFA